MLKTETVWKSSFLVVALGTLYFAWKKPVSPQVIEQDAASALPTPATVNFGGYQGASNPGGDITIGGSPVYLTYNYPAATNPVPGSGTTAAQGPSATPPVAPPSQPSKPCGGCGPSDKCRGTEQLTNSSLAQASVYAPNDLSNLMSLLSK
jgi:hypothetical protein